MSGMDKQAVIRCVRIAVSVFFGVLTVALVMFWVRSHWWADSVIDRVALIGGIHVQSSRGGLSLYGVHLDNPEVQKLFPMRMTQPIRSESFYDRHMNYTGLTPPPYCGFNIRFESFGDWSMSSPYWFLVAISGAFAAGTWTNRMPQRFSLRTLLIATTLVAMVLGLGVWLAS